MVAWTLLSLLFLISLTFVFLFVLKQIFSKKTAKVIGIVAMILSTGYMVITLLTMPLITHEEAVTIAKETVSPYIQERIYDNQIRADMNQGTYFVTIDIREEGYGAVSINTRNGEVLSTIVKKFNEEELNIK